MSNDGNSKYKISKNPEGGFLSRWSARKVQIAKGLDSPTDGAALDSTERQEM